MAYKQGDLDEFIFKLSKRGLDVQIETDRHSFSSFSLTQNIYIITANDGYTQMVVRENWVTGKGIQILEDDENDIWNSEWVDYSWEKFKKEIETYF